MILEKIKLEIRTSLRKIGLISLFQKIQAIQRCRLQHRVFQDFIKKKPEILELFCGESLLKIHPLNKEHYFDLVNLLEKNILIEVTTRIAPGDVVWDVGASIGLFSLAMAKKVGRLGQVVSFEPDRESFKEFQNNMKINQVSSVTAFPFALGEKHEIKFLVKIDSSFVGNHVTTSLSNGSKGQKIVVKSGDELIENFGIPVPKLLKIDVEGDEFEVLKGLRKTLTREECRVVICEIHFSTLEKKGKKFVPLQIQDFLNSNGFFSLRWIDRSHLLAEKVS